jgi:hypothetical protein
MDWGASAFRFVETARYVTSFSEIRLVLYLKKDIITRKEN